MDARLHAERVESRTRRQRTTQALLGDLPDGAMVRHAGTAALVLGDSLLPWSFDGYGAARPIGAQTRVEVLTPPSAVAVLAAGYRPLLHPSAVSRSP
jgi:hypothetical protein